MNPVQAAVEAQKKSQQRAMMIGGVLAVLAAAVIGLTASGALGFNKEVPKTETLKLKAKPPETVALKQEGTVPPPPAEMPNDVYQWLKHLEECERLKVEISGDQSAEVMVYMQKNSVLGAGMGLMNPYDQSSDGDGDQDPATYTKGKILDLRPRWNELIQKYYSVQPPEECMPLAQDFGSALNEIPGVMGDLGGILNDLSNDPETALKTLKKMQNSSYGNIDRYFARADQKLGGICEKYNRQKWFNIVSDVGAGGILGKSLGGL
jgi:hypothetical protein